MRTTRDDMQVMLEAGPTSIRAIDWGNLRVLSVNLPAGTDLTPLLQGAENDLCQCPHWGYVLQGRMRIIYADDEETLSAGDFFYMPPGHTVIVEDDVEFVEFSPPAQYDEVLAVVQSNLEAATAG